MDEFFDFARHPGHLYVVATLLPLVSFLLLLLVGGKRAYLRRYRDSGDFRESLYRLLGGDAPGRGGAYVALAAIVLAFVCTLVGFIWYTSEQYHLHDLHHQVHTLEGKLHQQGLSSAERAAAKQEIEEAEKEIEELEAPSAPRWSGQITWASIKPAGPPKKNKPDEPPDPTMPAGLPDPDSGTALYLGYYIDSLAAVMFLMVTLIASLIHLFSIGYMSEELAPTVEDHQVHGEHGHLHRRGRFPRFFMFLSLFCFAMLNLVLANNLFQVFVSWELVGICSYLLIGFYYERRSAANAANKAFITNRVGDAGFIIGLLILWTYLGTLNFQDIFARIRAPLQDAHGKALELSGQIVRANLVKEKDGVKTLEIAQNDGSQVLLFPREPHIHANDLAPFARDKANPEALVRRTITNVEDSPGPRRFGVMPYWLLVLAGLGVFLGCVGKSAQFPLQVWLPDAMEGPTPVSALIHAATMVAAGVYLVGRCFPLFAPEALLVIAYTGAITLTVAATIALVMTDIKKVLAYSTVSQLGYMMLALGVGGWVAGLFHLVTHAFFKALLFLCSGSVIYGCHHVQEMPHMGGLYPKMKVTALTMLVGVLAIAGTPLFSGWYSKDAMLAQALGFGLVHREHFLLFVLPVLTAGLTTFYMFRMWFLTFTGKPRDEHVYEHAHESPWTMTLPLVVLAFFSVVVAWGWPVWDPEASWLEHQLHHSQPTSVIADFGYLAEVGETWEGGPVKELSRSERHQGHEYHAVAGFLALVMALLGFVFAAAVYYYRLLDPAEAAEQFPLVHRFLWRKWYFDELYSATLVRPALVAAAWCRWFDAAVIDGGVHATARAAIGTSRGSGWFDLGIVDGLVNLTARVLYGVGNWLRNLQTGYIRSYVLFLVLAAVALWVILSLLAGTPAPAR